jgi:hypothetical protein
MVRTGWTSGNGFFEGGGARWRVRMSSLAEGSAKTGESLAFKSGSTVDCESGTDLHPYSTGWRLGLNCVAVGS